MKRRYFLNSITAASPLLALGASKSLQASDKLSQEADALTVGGFSIADIEAIDTHVHPPAPITLSQSYDKWNSSFVDAMLPNYDYDGKAELRDKLDKRFKEQLYAMPRQIGYYNYMARAYGVSPDISGFDSVVSAGIKSGFTDYIRSILDREKVATVVLQSAEAEPHRPKSAIPDDRFVWTWPVIDLIQPQWAADKGYTSISQVTQGIFGQLQEAVSNGCRGFKNWMAYYRPLAFDVVDSAAAEKAMKLLLENPATRFVPGRNVPDYQEPELQTAFRTYQDYLLRQIYIKAGELKTPIIIHTAVALHPALRFEYNSPVELPRVFLDDDIKRVETQFVLIHTGYPYHEFVAAMLSQFPNVYTDVSFYSKFPGVLEETLRAFFALAPSEKVMHGSDSNNVPEEIGYCAWNTRHVLAKVLRDYRAYYGWSQRDCQLMANNMLHDNAMRVFKI